MTEETRIKLRDSAIRNKLGGKVLVDKKCEQCGIGYKGIPTQLRCKICKLNGYPLVCKHCENEFRSKYKGVVYCKSCSDSKLFLKGKPKPGYIGERIRHSKLKFFQTEKGKLIAKGVGEKNSVALKIFFNTERGRENIKSSAIKQSVTMKNLIRDGKFTPPVTNSFTHWTAEILLGKRIYKFRSSWEACFWVSNQHLLYESKECRTEVVDRRVYVGDFFDATNKILYEIKPKSFYLKQSKKIDALIEHCRKSGYTFIWINEYNILNYITPKTIKGQNIKQLKKLYEGVTQNKNKINN